MNCRRVRSQMPGYVDRELTAWRAGTVEEHLAACDDCRRLHTNLKTLHRRIVYDRRMLPVPNGLHDAILLAIERQEGAGRVVDLQPVADPLPRHAGTSTRRAIADKSGADLLAALPAQGLLSIVWCRRLNWTAKSVAVALVVAALGWGLWHRYRNPPQIGFNMASLNGLARDYPAGDFRDLGLLSGKAVAATLADPSWDAAAIANSRLVQLLISDVRSVEDVRAARRLIDLAAGAVTQAGVAPVLGGFGSPRDTSESGFYRHRMGIDGVAADAAPGEAIAALRRIDASKLDGRQRATVHLRLADAHLKLGELEAATTEARLARRHAQGHAQRRLADALDGIVRSAAAALPLRDERAASFDGLSDPVSRAAGREALADLLLAAGCTRDAADLYKTLIDRPGAEGARCLLKLGHAMQELGEHAVRLALAEHLCRIEGLPEEFAVLSRIELASALLAGPNPKPAMAARHYEQALDAATAPRWQVTRGMLMYTAARLYFESGLPADGHRIAARAEADREAPAEMRRLVSELGGRHRENNPPAPPAASE